MADKLGGHAFLIHAPLFADSVAEKKMLMKMKSVTDVFDRARKARVAVLGIGSILSGDSSYYDLHPTSRGDRAEIEKAGAAGELLAHLIDSDGEVCDYELNARAGRDEPDGARRHPVHDRRRRRRQQGGADLRRASRPACRRRWCSTKRPPTAS